MTNGEGAGQYSLLRLTSRKIRRMLWECGQNDDCRLINLLRKRQALGIGVRVRFSGAKWLIKMKRHAYRELGRRSSRFNG